VVFADVERAGTKITYTNYNAHLVEGLSDRVRRKVELLTPDRFMAMLDKFYESVIASSST
jgi:hypothetical protein